ncbi:MAG TPA: hypothetical protein VN158_05390 [Caulobacter sp.]|nr:MULTISPECIES: hypothetical protein [unclassified Caulobacter]HJV41915.1 hypothetical protein [Caulobacter sp.]HWU79483.1 hypothetical protein [Caulobacter sp.]
MRRLRRMPRERATI